jgi:cytochrome c biogenesis protein CcmG/thiol:disulfide interchange protein DsbE
VGDLAPSFELTALDGRPMVLSAQSGRIVVLNVFASWCAPCRLEAPDIEQTWRAYQGRDVQFFGLGYKDAPSKAQAFLDEFDVTYPCAVESENSTALEYGVTGVPETFVIDRDGRVLHHIIGPVEGTRLAALLDEALSQ